MDVESYTKNITTITSGGFISCAMVIGRDLNLFEALKKSKEPMTSKQLAEECKLKERYVQEWLGCMVSSNVVFVDKNNNYFIEESLKPGLDAMDVLRVYPLMTSYIDKAKECFREGGPRGYGYSDMPSNIGALISQRIKDWKKTAEQMLVPVRKQKDSFTQILDLGCGSGMLSMEIAKQFPKAEVYGVDFIDTNVETATKFAESEGITNVTFLQRDIVVLPEDWTKKFDYIILMDVLHDLTCPDECMQEVKRVLKDDGVVTIVDPKIHSDHKSNAGDIGVAGVGYAVSQVFCLPYSMSVDGAPGLGMGWGIERKENFLTDREWIVKAKTTLQSPFQYAFTCTKAKNKKKVVTGE